MDTKQAYDPSTDAVLIDLTHNTIVDVNVDLAQELHFTLKNGEVHAATLSLFSVASVDAACDAIFARK